MFTDLVKFSRYNTEKVACIPLVVVWISEPIFVLQISIPMSVEYEELAKARENPSEDNVGK